MSASTMTRYELAQLYVRVGQAWELRGSPYFVDACQAIVDWDDRRALARLELELEKTARAILLLRWPPEAALVAAA
jgi:hypothetical protein